MKGNFGKRLHDRPKLPCISNYIIELYSKYKMRKVNYDKGSQQQKFRKKWKATLTVESIFKLVRENSESL